MDVAMMQPTFLPWQGYFELIYKSDKFIFLDDFQFSARSYHQRNRLFVIKGRVDWYSVPVQKSLSSRLPINKTKIDDGVPWREKMLRRIKQNYSRASYYSIIIPFVEKWLSTFTETISEHNISFIKSVCTMLHFKPEFLTSSQYTSEMKRSERIIELLRWCGATHYYSARGSSEYMFGNGIFPVKDVVVLFQDFQPKPYKQVGSPHTFIPYLSVLDALMNVGPEATAELIKTGTEHWLTWDEMNTILQKQGQGVSNED